MWTTIIQVKSIYRFGFVVSLKISILSSPINISFTFTLYWFLRNRKNVRFRLQIFKSRYWTTPIMARVYSRCREFVTPETRRSVRPASARRRARGKCVRFGVVRIVASALWVHWTNVEWKRFVRLTRHCLPFINCRTAAETVSIVIVRTCALYNNTL